MKEIIISNGMIMQVDNKWYEELNKWKWSYSTHGYAYRKKYIGMVNGKKKYESIFAHRFVMGLSKGDKLWIDHKDENKLNVQEYNLRTATPTQNNANRQSPNIAKQSQYKGVCKNSKSNSWRAYINCNGSRIGLGSHKFEEDAAIAYNNKAKELFGEFANLNILEGNI